MYDELYINYRRLTFLCSELEGGLKPMSTSCKEHVVKGCASSPVMPSPCPLPTLENAKFIHFAERMRTAMDIMRGRDMEVMGFP